MRNALFSFEKQIYLMSAIMYLLKKDKMKRLKLLKQLVLSSLTDGSVVGFSCCGKSKGEKKRGEKKNVAIWPPVYLSKNFFTALKMSFYVYYI